MALSRVLQVGAAGTKDGFDPRRAFSEEERRGLELALRVRVAALLAVEVWLLIGYRALFSLYYHGFIVAFLLLALLQLALLAHGRDRPWHRFLFVALDGLLLSAVLLTTSPLLEESPPPAMVLRYGNEVFFFVFIASMSLTYSPALVLWTGVSAVAAWGLGIALMLLWHGDAIVTSLDLLWTEDRSMAEAIAIYMRPDFVHLRLLAKIGFVVLLVSAILAAVAWRARRVVQRQVAADRARSNLARYFSPNMVEQLAAQDQPLGAVRRQAVAVLFADIKGFTTLCEKLPPEAVVALLRAFHERMERAVFACGGTLDKYIGDGLMATFGTPRTGPRDAGSALACARHMLAEIAALNRERAVQDLPAIAIGIGVHYGPVVQGDIGGPRRLEFTVLGDTVNVASRLEAMTRELDTTLVVSQDLLDRIAEEAEPPDLSDLLATDPQTIRGRDGKLCVWRLPGGESRGDGDSVLPAHP